MSDIILSPASKFHTAPSRFQGDVMGTKVEQQQTPRSLPVRQQVKPTPSLSSSNPSSYKNIAISSQEQPEYKQVESDFPDLPDQQFVDHLSYKKTVPETFSLSAPSRKKKVFQDGGDIKVKDEEDGGGNINPSIMATLNAISTDAEEALKAANTPLRRYSKYNVEDDDEDEDEDEDEDDDEDEENDEEVKEAEKGIRMVKEEEVEEEDDILGLASLRRQYLATSAASLENSELGEKVEEERVEEERVEEVEAGDEQDDEDGMEEDDTTVPVVIHGIKDELNINALLQVHKDFQESELVAAAKEERRIAAASLKPSGRTLMVMVNGRWQLRPPKIPKLQTTNQGTSKPGKGGRRGRKGSTSNGGKNETGRPSKKRSKSAGSKKRSIHMPFSVLTKQLKLRKAAEDELFSAQQSEGEDGLTSIQSPRQLNKQPWNPILTKVERKRREIRNLRKRIRQQGLKIDYKKNDGYGTFGGGESGNEDESKASPIHSKSRSKSTPSGHRTQEWERRRLWHLAIKEQEEKEKEIIRTKEKNKRQSVALFTIFIVAVISIVFALWRDRNGILKNQNFQTVQPLTLETEQTTPPIMTPPIMTPPIMTPPITSSPPPPIMKAFEYPSLRLLYPGNGETIFSSSSISIKWASIESLTFEDFYIRINGNQYKVDQEGYRNNGMNLIGMSPGLHSIKLEGKIKNMKNQNDSIELNSWFRILPRPESLPVDFRDGELNVLKSLSTNTLIQLRNSNLMPSIRKRMMDNILKERELGYDSEFGFDIDIQNYVTKVSPSTATATTADSIPSATTVPASATMPSPPVRKPPISKENQQQSCIKKCEESPLGNYAKMACVNGCTQQ
jgi:hypothetical protein